MDALKFLFQPNMYALLIWFVAMAVAIAYKRDMLVIALVVVFAVGSMWYFDRVPVMPVMTDSQPAMPVMHSAAAASETIAGPVEGYQDNTWDEKNLATTVTQVPDAIDIQGEVGDGIQGFHL